MDDEVGGKPAQHQAHSMGVSSAGSGWWPVAGSHPVTGMMGVPCQRVCSVCSPEVWRVFDVLETKLLLNGLEGTL